jgi:predicted GNAT superfamily acetyltransferase
MLALNTVHEVELSPLTAQSIATLVDSALHVTVIDDRAAFLVTFDQDADYDSPNFLWFRGRYERFAYVDRIAVDTAHRGGGLARLLYENFFDHARALGHDTVACEVNSDPPNPASDAFHASLGFEVVGEAELPGRGKTVRYLRKVL